MVGNGGFQPQSKPPVHTGGFDLIERTNKLAKLLTTVRYRTIITNEIKFGTELL